MKNILKILLVISIGILIKGCNTKSNIELIQGEWKFKASYDVNSDNALEQAKPEDPMFAIITSEKITLTSKSKSMNDEIYFWKIKGDSLYVTTDNKKNTYPIYLKVLTEEKLEVELYILGKTRLEFIRNKN